MILRPAGGAAAGGKVALADRPLDPDGCQIGSSAGTPIEGHNRRSTLVKI
jgi:hypothetical protein